MIFKNKNKNNVLQIKIIFKNILTTIEEMKLVSRKSTGKFGRNEHLK